ncbi:MAG TPA: MFS transporter [Ktedonobacterales bacterium]
MTQTQPNARDDSSQRERRLSARPRRTFAIRKARWVFWLMFAINVLNYLDRLIAVAAGPTIKAEFSLKDRDIGLLSSAFLLVYTLSALPLGLLADRARSRARIVALGVGVWSVFSGLTALARGFFSLVATRALVGVGEASYYPAGTALLSAYFPREARARIMGRWQAGQMIGVLLAFGLVGALFAVLPAAAAWRVAFLISAGPGLVLAGLMWFVTSTPHASADASSSDGTLPARDASRFGSGPPRSYAGQLLAALSIPSIWIVIALQSLVFTVTTPAITFLPIYIRSHNGPFRLSAAHASLLTGLIVVVGGVTGALLGGHLADWLRRWHPGARVLAPGAGMLVAMPFLFVMLLTTRLPIFCVAGTLTVLALNLTTGPLTAIPQDVAPPHLRASVVAVTMVISHLLGDVWSPTVVGVVATALHERAGPALLIVGGPALALGVAVAIVGAGIYARNLSVAARD